MVLIWEKLMGYCEALSNAQSQSQSWSQSQSQLSPLSPRTMEKYKAVRAKTAKIWRARVAEAFESA